MVVGCGGCWLQACDVELLYRHELVARQKLVIRAKGQ